MLWGCSRVYRIPLIHLTSVISYNTHTVLSDQSKSSKLTFVKKQGAPGSKVQEELDVGDCVVGDAVEGDGVAGDCVVGDCVVGDCVVGDCVGGAAVDGAAVGGAAVDGAGVGGAAVVGAAVGGAAVVGAGVPAKMNSDTMWVIQIQCLTQIRWYWRKI